MTWRRSKQRDAVLGVLRELGGFRTVREIHGALRGRGERVGLSTVYRIVQSLVDLGEVDMMPSAGGGRRYRLPGSEHHHHLVCRTCGAIVEVRGPTLETWAERIAEENDFTDVGHSLDIIGTCPRCAAGA
ncbi:transcriptional repressor [Actinomycetes bacterium KLBMP 9797]